MRMSRHTGRPGTVRVPRTTLSETGWMKAHPWSIFRLFGLDVYRKVYEDLHGTYLMTERGRSKKIARAALYSLFAPASMRPRHGGRRPKM